MDTARKGGLIGDVNPKVTNFEQSLVYDKLRPDNYHNRGYSTFAPFFFRPLPIGKYNLRWSEYRDWDGDTINHMVYNSETSNFTEINQQKIIEEPILMKAKISEPKNTKAIHGSYSWTRFFRVKQYNPRLSNIVDKGTTVSVGRWKEDDNDLKEKRSVSTIHKFDFGGFFQSEKQRITVFGLDGDNSMIEGIAIQYGHILTKVTAQIQNWSISGPNEIISAIQSTQGKTCPPAFYSPNEDYFYLQTFEHLEKCSPEDEKVTMEDSFCGSKSVKIETGKSNKWYYSLFEEDKSISDCNNAQHKFMSFEVDQHYLEHINRYLCFAYKGYLKPHKDNFYSYVEASYSYIDQNGQFGYIENTKMWTTKLDVKEETINDWKWACVDLIKSFKWSMDYINRNDLPGSIKNGAYGHRFTSLKLALNQNVIGHVYIDQIIICKQIPKATSSHIKDIKYTFGASVADVNFEKISENVYDFEITPGSCSTGHEMIGFYGEELIEREYVSGNTHSLIYTKAAWPQNSFIKIERIQASKTSMEGSIEFKYRNEDKSFTSVKFDISTQKVPDLVNAFALAGFRTNVTLNAVPTCKSLSFNVEYNSPGGSISLPEIIGGDKLETQSRILQEGYEEFMIDMGWFITAHKKPQVQVIIDGMYSTCQFGRCDFEYLKDITPYITRVHPMENLVAGKSNITIFGRNIEDLVITSPSCLVKETYPDKVICSVEGNVSAGLYELIAFDLHKGKPVKSISEKLHVQYDIEKIEPSTILVGGSYHNLTGSGLACDMNISLCRKTGRNDCEESNTWQCKIDQNTCRHNFLNLLCSTSGSFGKLKVYVNGRDSGLTVKVVTGPRLVSIVGPDRTEYTNQYKTQIVAKEKVYIKCTKYGGGFGEDKNKVKVRFVSIFIHFFNGSVSTSK